MKKEDFTDRLIRRFFGVMGPFDEYRQQVIYRVAARALVQILYSILALFMLYLFIGQYFSLIRDVYPWIVMLLILAFGVNARRQVKMLELEKDDESEMTYPRFTHKQVLRRTWLTFVGVPLAFFLHTILQRSFADHQNFFSVLWSYLSHPISILLLILYLFVGGIFAGIVYSMMSEYEEKD